MLSRYITSFTSVGQKLLHNGESMEMVAHRLQQRRDQNECSHTEFVAFRADVFSGIGLQGSTIAFLFHR